MSHRFCQCLGHAMRVIANESQEPFKHYGVRQVQKTLELMEAESQWYL